jgi:type I restriction enzyme M protein
MVDRVLRAFDDEKDIHHIADTFHAWKKAEGYQDAPGFSKAATLADIRAHDYILTPGRYVGAAEREDDGEPFEEKILRLTTQLNEQFAESTRLERMIRNNLKWLEYGV